MRITISKVGLMALIALLAATVWAQDHNKPDNKNKNPSQPVRSLSSSPRDGEPAAKPVTETPGATSASQPGTTDGGQDPTGGKDKQSQAATTSWLSEPNVIGLIGVIAFLGVALHVVHVLTESRYKKEFARLHSALQMLSQRASMAEDPGRQGRAGLPDELVQRLNRHRQALDQLSMQINQWDERISTNERRSAEAATAVALAAHMAGAPRISQALNDSRQDVSDADRAAAIQIVERFREILGANAARVKPLTQELAVLAGRLAGQPNLAPLEDRVRGLLRELEQVEEWHAGASDRLALLQRGSAASRSSAFAKQQSGLVEELNAGTISIVDYVKGYRDLMENHFPSASGSAQDSIEPDAHENDLKEWAAAAPDYLMNWFDKLFQLQCQAGQASVGAQAAAELARIQATARDVLCKFDIQPDEIQIGLTGFDRRLHDAALITQSSQFPANSVIGVQQCGFRKLSTGDVLRRPKVIVAGVGAT